MQTFPPIAQAQVAFLHSHFILRDGRRVSAHSARTVIPGERPLFCWGRGPYRMQFTLNVRRQCTTMQQGG